ncbi:MAG: hypothetical protein ACLTV2_04555 [Acutalibacter sp.]
MSKFARGIPGNLPGTAVPAHDTQVYKTSKSGNAFYSFPSGMGREITMSSVLRSKQSAKE